MNKDVYEKTRYQNIVRHKKNKNYVIRNNKTSVSKIDGKKILNIDDAIKLRDKILKDGNRDHFKAHTGTFKELWSNYIKYSENVSKLAFNTLKKKHIIYNKYLSELDDEQIKYLTKERISEFIDLCVCSDKQKNTILVILKGFFTYLVEQDILENNPTSKIKPYKVIKSEMRYWTTEELKRFISSINSLKSPDSMLVKMLVILECNLGDRIGETRALTWASFDESHSTLTINHSINYDLSSKDYLSSTKNYQSMRTIDVSEKLIECVNEYKDYLVNLYGDVNELIFYNYKLKKPYSDTHLRNLFKKYCIEFNVPVIRLYDLRHTYVTMMMSEGWELYHISKRIGHKNFHTTVDKYGHIESEIRKEIASTSDKFF